MIGFLFTEFLEMLEKHHGIAYVENVISNASLSNSGAFTAIGYYSRTDMEQLLESYSRVSGNTKNEVCYSFGYYLAEAFPKRFPRYYEHTPDFFSFLLQLNKRIKTEIAKLYPEVIRPAIKAKQLQTDRIDLVYESPNRLGDLVEGFLAGHAAYYNETVSIVRFNLNEEASKVRFVIKKGKDHD